MVKILLWTATVAVLVSLVSAFLAIVFGCSCKEDLLSFAQMLLSWPVVSGGVTIGVGSAFGNEIRLILGRLGKTT